MYESDPKVSVSKQVKLLFKFQYNCRYRFQSKTKV